jgi:RNA recognition motif-containing protein
VGNLPSNLTRNDLILLFEPFGTIRVVNLMTDELTGVNLGFGYVEFESSEAARNAALKLDNVPLRLALQAESTGFANSYVRIKVNVTRQMRYPDGEMSWVR